MAHTQSQGNRISKQGTNIYHSSVRLNIHTYICISSINSTFNTFHNFWTLQKLLHSTHTPLHMYIHVYRQMLEGLAIVLFLIFCFCIFYTSNICLIGCLKNQKSHTKTTKEIHEIVCCCCFRSWTASMSAKANASSWAYEICVFTLYIHM